MRLLLAEDERELADALQMILKHHNYSVDLVYNGKDALDYLQSDNYDGAILDIMMPEMDGLSVVKKLRGQGNNVPILLLTAKAEIDDMVEGLDFGADDYMTKPFSMKELLARIRAITRRGTEARSAILQYKDLQLNSTSFVLRCKGKEIHLPNKEYQIMEMLMINPGQIISGDRMLEKIWGLESEVEASVVWVNISYLRKKINAIQSEVQIKAARGQGYYI